MLRAIDEYIIKGCQTTLPFCKFVFNHQAFTSGNFDTNFVKNYFTPQVLQSEYDQEKGMIAAMIALKISNEKSSNVETSNNDARNTSLWKQNRIKQ
jgi:propionyl-CoA carboxylase alpha chain